MKHKLSSAAILLATIVTTLFASAGPASAALPPGVTIYQPAYSDNIYPVLDGITYDPLTYDEWASFGFPTPRSIASVYVKYSWAPTIYAITSFPDGPLQESIGLEGWLRAGAPGPRTVGFIEGTHFYRWVTSPELFAFTEDDGISHKLSFIEWVASGYQTPETSTSQGFFRLSWSSSPGIVYQDLADDTVEPLTLENWVDEDYPTPLGVPRLTGDAFYTFNGSPDIFYAGPTLDETVITLDEWIAAGSPAPELRAS
jgi:hypothetical protein